MQIQYCSDLHLEFDRNKQYLLRNPLKIQGEVLILAGDIMLLKEGYLKHPYFDLFSDNYEIVFWVPGNHEYYNNDLTNFINKKEIFIRKNVLLVNNCVINFKEVRFLFSTLWSEISQLNEKIIERNVADFHLIFNENKKLKVADYNLLHKDSLDFLDKELKRSKNKTVVVTHHPPSNLCIAAEYKNSGLNEAFCVDLTGFIEEHYANYWIYGHNHFNQKPLVIENTTLLTNQLGYVHLGENLDFRNDASFSI